VEAKNESFLSFGLSTWTALDKSPDTNKCHLWEQLKCWSVSAWSAMPTPTLQSSVQAVVLLFCLSVDEGSIDEQSMFEFLCSRRQSLGI